MRNLILAAALTAFASPVIAQTVYVKPHWRADGTYVPGHHRTTPNNTRRDNWSTEPNVNPFTGKSGDEPPRPTYPVYRTYRSTDPASTLPPSTQDRWQKQFPLTCKYSDIC